jgi:hypothetical protein
MLQLEVATISGVTKGAYLLEDVGKHRNDKGGGLTGASLCRGSRHMHRVSGPTLYTIPGGITDMNRTLPAVLCLPATHLQYQ